MTVMAVMMNDGMGVMVRIVMICRGGMMIMMIVGRICLCGRGVAERADDDRRCGGL